MRINTNIASMNAQANNAQINKNLSNSLEKLSSGLRINKAADDASGMSIADKLRTQASSVGQGISNANSGSALIQIADKAMDEQSNILDIVKTKLIQAATSTTSKEGREAIRKDIQKLLNQVDNISAQTNYNGVNLLNKKGTDFTFQVGGNATDLIGMKTAYSVNTQGLGSAGIEGTSQAYIKDTSGTAGVVIEGEVPNVKLTATSTSGTVTLTGTEVSGVGGNATLKIAAENVSELNFAKGTGSAVTLVTEDPEAIAFLNEQSAVSTSDGLTKITNGQYQLTQGSGSPTGIQFSNSQKFDFTDLKISDITGTEAITIKTRSEITIEKTGGARDINVTGAQTFKIDGDTAEGVSFGTEVSTSLQDGTVGIHADNSSANKYVALNTVAASTIGQSGELAFTVATDSKVTSLTLTNSAGSGSVTLNTTDGITAKALRDAGLKENLDSSFTLTTSGTTGTMTINFSGGGVDIKNLSFSDVTKTTGGGQDAIFIETAGAVTVENDKPDTSDTNSLNVSLSVANQSSPGGIQAVAGFSASVVNSGLGSSNLSGLLSLGSNELSAETANNFMSVVDDALTQLNTVRSDFGSTQNQLSSAIRNMMVTQVNLKAAESVIRDVDYAKESANFNKQNIIAQAGTYAMSQANQVQQNVLRLLQ